MMRHLILSVVAFFSHPRHMEQPKPVLDKDLLDRTVAQLNLDDPVKTVCVYPLPKEKLGGKSQEFDTERR